LNTVVPLANAGVIVPDNKIPEPVKEESAN
jgi:hypothetical protein